VHTDPLVGEDGIADPEDDGAHEVYFALTLIALPVSVSVR
jgi:hypothetical protein